MIRPGNVDLHRAKVNRRQESSINPDQRTIRRNGAIGLTLCALLLVATIYYFPFSPEDPWFFHGAMIIQVLALGAGLLLGAAAERHSLLSEGRLQPATSSNAPETAEQATASPKDSAEPDKSDAPTDAETA